MQKHLDSLTGVPPWVGDFSTALNPLVVNGLLTDLR